MRPAELDGNQCASGAWTGLVMELPVESLQLQLSHGDGASHGVPARFRVGNSWVLIS